MKISEMQVMQLITKCKDYSILLSYSDNPSADIQFNQIRDLLDEIANQQSKELKEINND